MKELLDPYYTWLGIPPREQPPNHYRLLSLELFEDNTDAIEHAADRQMLHVRTFQTGPYSAQSQKLLNELAAASVCLLDENAKRRYDEGLRKALARRAERAAAESPLPPPSAPARSSGVRERRLPPPVVARPNVSPPSATVDQPASKPPPTSANGSPKDFAAPRVPPPRPAAANASADVSAAEPRPYRRRRRRSMLPAALFTTGVVAILVALFAIASAAGVFLPQSNGDGRALRNGAADSENDLTADKSLTSTTKRRNNKPPDSRTVKPVEKKVDTSYGDFVTGKSAGDDAEGKPQRRETVAVTLSAAPTDPTKEDPAAPAPSTKAAVAEKPSKTSAPAGDDLAAAQNEMQEIYAETIAKVKTPAEKSALAELLLKDARDVDLEPSIRWVVLETAYQAALEVGDFLHAQQAVELIAADYEIDALARRSELLKQAARQVDTEVGYREVAVASLDLIPRLIAEKRFVEARILAGRAEKISWQQLRDVPLRNNLQAQLIDISRSERQWQAVEEARTRLEVEPRRRRRRLNLRPPSCGG